MQTEDRLTNTYNHKNLVTQSNLFLGLSEYNWATLKDNVKVEKGLKHNPLIRLILNKFVKLKCGNVDTVRLQLGETVGFLLSMCLLSGTLKELFINSLPPLTFKDKFRLDVVIEVGDWMQVVVVYPDSYAKVNALSTHNKFNTVKSVAMSKTINKLTSSDDEVSQSDTASLTHDTQIPKGFIDGKYKIMPYT